jgi:ectoine hydroxylase-related dioxygenase (phytanoyl-CoA dioxygenase family)
MSDLAQLWHAGVPFDGVKISGVQLEAGTPVTLSHAELLAVPLERRLEAHDRSTWWVNDIGRVSANARAIAASPVLAHVCDLILGSHTEVESTTTLWGTGEHPLHQDVLHEPTLPLNMCLGIDVVCEDMHPDAGPVVFYPGSHRSMWPGWTNYPETSLATCDDATMRAYRAWVNSTAEQFPRRTSLCRKGDIFIWHGSLIHCGTASKDRSRRRKSFVLHSFPPGCNKTHEVKAARVRQGFGNLSP